MRALQNEQGFTLIEALVAVAVLTIGIVSTYAFQVASVKGNGSASNLTTAVTMAQDRMEQLLGLDYDDIIDVKDQDGHDGMAGINEKTAATADGNDESDPNYNVYWNVAADELMKRLPDAPKTIRVIVTYNGGKEVALTYYKNEQI